MPLIKKATIKSYSAATHKATVQIAGSLGVWLDAIRVATDIPAADVIAGRQCTVLFLDPANQDDAVVLTIQGALPSGGGGGTTDHGALTGLADDDHTQYGALAQAETWAALQTFSAGLQLAASQAIKDSGGTNRIIPTTIGVDIDGHLAVGATTPSTLFLAILNETSAVTQFGLQFTLDHSGGATDQRGVNASMADSGTAVTPTVTGGYYRATHRSLSASAASLVSVSAIQFEDGGWGIGWTASYGFRALTPVYPLAKPTSQYGFYAHDAGVAGITNVYGLYIENQTAGGTVRRLIEALGLTNVNLRVEAGDPTTPGASKGRSQLLGQFNENGVLAVRRVEWIDAGAAGGAGIPANAKVLVAT